MKLSPTQRGVLERMAETYGIDADRSDPYGILIDLIALHQMEYIQKLHWTWSRSAYSITPAGRRALEVE